MGITLWQHLADRSIDMAKNAFSGVNTLKDWQAIRPQRHKEYLRALGLDPLPERCDLKLTDRGPIEGPGFRARRLAFQIMPDCWSSAAIYYPDPLPAGRAPGVLYVCGHGSIGTWHYHYHPIMWARRGYVCLIVDTIEQNDNPGEHHASLMGRFEPWVSLGYSAAGGEVWNAMRALDVLAADPQVDPERLGVTGVSGGGACSFEVAVADERLKAVSTLCGVSTPLDAIANGHIMVNCDCFYPHNVYRRDLSEYAALLAPRAALFCFRDHDPLFHLSETKALVERTRTIYRLYGEEARCEHFRTPGPHGDSPIFDEATARWFDRYVAGEDRPLVERGGRDLTERQTTVFNGQPPTPNRTALLPHLLSPHGTVPLPQGPEDWPAVRREALARLREAVPFLEAREEAATFACDGEWQWAGKKPILNCAHRGAIGGVDVWAHAVTPPDVRPILLLSVGGEGQSSLLAISRAACSLESKTLMYGGFQPRVGGFNSVDPAPVCAPPGHCLQPLRTSLVRAMALVGLTPVMMTIRDLAVAVEYFLGRPEVQGRDIYLYGRGDAGVASLYYALLDERIAGVALEEIPSSHLDGGAIIGVLRAFDIPQAVGLMAPRKVVLINPGHCFWSWPTRAYERVGCPERFQTANDLRQGFDKLLGKPLEG